MIGMVVLVEKMKENLSERYFAGEAIPAKDFTVSKEALEFFGDIVWYDFKHGKEVGQFDLEGEIWHYRVNPVPKELTPEEAHLRRNGSRFYERK